MSRVIAGPLPKRAHAEGAVVDQALVVGRHDDHAGHFLGVDRALHRGVDLAVRHHASPVGGGVRHAGAARADRGGGGQAGGGSSGCRDGSAGDRPCVPPPLPGSATRFASPDLPADLVRAA
ncbi:MAG: hypothetical protein WDO24_07785 [Pseudomonadota bacterium]